MKPNNLNRNNVIIAIGSLLLIGAVVFYFFTRDNSSDEELLASAPVGEVSGVEGNLLSTLRQLKSLKLDDTIFKDAVFVRLSDFSQPLGKQPVGRSNPFAPLGTDLTSTSITNTPTNIPR